MSESDILLKSELDSLAAKHPDQFKVYYVLNNPPEGWKGGVGFVTKEMIEEHLPVHAADHKALLCGASRPSFSSILPVAQRRSRGRAANVEAGLTLSSPALPSQAPRP